MTVRETLAELLDMDDPAMARVVATTINAMRATRAHWQSKGLPGTPSVMDYAEDVRAKMRSEYYR